MFTVQPYLYDYARWEVRRQGDSNCEVYRAKVDAQKRAKQLMDFSRRTGTVVFGNECYLRIKRGANA